MIARIRRHTDGADMQPCTGSADTSRRSYSSVCLQVDFHILNKRCLTAAELGCAELSDCISFEIFTARGWRASVSSACLVAPLRNISCMRGSCSA